MKRTVLRSCSQNFENRLRRAEPSEWRKHRGARTAVSGAGAGEELDDFSYGEHRQVSKSPAASACPVDSQTARAATSQTPTSEKGRLPEKDGPGFVRILTEARVEVLGDTAGLLLRRHGSRHRKSIERSPAASFTQRDASISRLLHRAGPERQACENRYWFDQADAVSPAAAPRMRFQIGSGCEYILRAYIYPATRKRC